MILSEEQRNYIIKSIIEANNELRPILKTIKLSVPGNLEPFEKEIEEEVSLNFSLQKFTITKLTTLEDEGRTRITISFLRTIDIIKHIEELNEKLRIRQTPKQYLNALNKAILIAEDFNNRFGEGHLNKTAELNELDDILQKLK